MQKVNVAVAQGASALQVWAGLQSQESLFAALCVLTLQKVLWL